MSLLLAGTTKFSDFSERTPKALFYFHIRCFPSTRVSTISNPGFPFRSLSSQLQPYVAENSSDRPGETINTGSQDRGSKNRGPSCVALSFSIKMQLMQRRRKKKCDRGGLV